MKIFSPFKFNVSINTLSDKQLLKSIYVAILLALLLPPFIGGSLMGLVGFYPLPEFYYIFFNYSAVYVFVVCGTILSFVPRLHKSIVQLAKNNNDISIRRAQFVLSRAPVYLFLFVTIYSIGGALSADFSLENMGVRDYTIREHLIHQFGIIPVVLITSFPIFFYFVDRLGRYLGPRGVYVTAIPMWVKMLMLGIVTPLLIDSLLIGYYYNRTGYFEIETLILWLLLLMLAIGGTWLAWRSLKQSLAPLEKFVGAYSNSIADNIEESLIPLSLDELGILTAQFDKLLLNQRALSNSLKLERDFATTILNTTPMISVLLDTRGYIQYISPYFEKLSGYKLSEVKDKEWFSYFLPERDQARIRELFLHAMNVEPTRGYINPITLRSGEERFIEWYDQVIRDTEGKVTEILAVGQDVTDRLSNEEELAQYRHNLEELVDKRTKELHEAQDELVRKERLATLGQLTATVSHELRNPLGAMRPSMYVIQKKSNQQDEQVQNAIERIDRNIDRCDRIIDELLDFTRITELNMKAVRFDDWLGALIEEQLIPEGIELKKEFGLKDIELTIDKDRLRRAVINVLENANHSMMDDNQQVVKDSAADLDIKTESNNARIEIIITDTGSGISKETLSKIFEPLFSTKGFGVGLGMPTVKQIMQQHGGGIEIESEESKGTQVSLWLPLNSMNNS